MNETMDNQQATSHQLSWLAGIWDGEGTFSIIYQEKKHGEAYIARITLSNTSEVMINEILRIFDSYDIKGHLWQEKPRQKHYKVAYHITINKLESVKLASELMKPYLISKKAHAELLIRYVNSRLKYKKKPIRDKKTGRILGMETQGYSEEEKSFFIQMKELNS